MDSMTTGALIIGTLVLLFAFGIFVLVVTVFC